MTMNPKLVIPALLLPMLLTGCSVNAPVTVPVDVHDNTINTGPVTGVPGTTGNNPSGIDSPLDDVDPNAPQDIPDGWDENDVDTPDPIPLPTPQG